MDGHRSRKWPQNPAYRPTHHRTIIYQVFYGLMSRVWRLTRTPVASRRPGTAKLDRRGGGVVVHPWKGHIDRHRHLAGRNVPTAPAGSRTELSCEVVGHRCRRRERGLAPPRVVLVRHDDQLDRYTPLGGGVRQRLCAG